MKVSFLTFVMLLTSVTVFAEIATTRSFAFAKQDDGARNDKRRIV